ncbi:MAG: hypothetical protein AAB799_01420 [Patescibacteria group bacterium]
MSTNLVGDTSVELAGVVGDIMTKYRARKITLDHLKRFADMDPMPFAIKAKDAKREIERFAAKTARQLSTVFKKRIIVDPIPPEFTDENLALWAVFNMKPIFLPGEDIDTNRPLKKWTKLEQFFYENVLNGKVKPIHPDLPPTLLRGCWCLADFTVSADYTDGSQVFVNDPLLPIIADLRQKKLVGRHNNTPDGSRFSITPDEWQDVVLAHVASKLGVTRAQMRLERAIEFNAIGNLYDPNRGKFNAWEWFEDHFEDSSRLYGGYRGDGGLASVGYVWHDDRYGSFAARPLVSFAR